MRAEELLARLVSIREEVFELPSLSDSQTEELARLAQSEGVSGWLVRRLTDEHDGEPAAESLTKLLRDRVVAQLRHTVGAMTVFRKVTDALAAEGIRSVPLKGCSLVSDIYDDPCLRELRDIDILVEPENLEAAHRVTRALSSGYADNYSEEFTFLCRQHLRPLLIHGAKVELHHRLTNPSTGLGLPEPIGQHFERRADGWRLTDTAMLYHSAIHAYKHAMDNRAEMKWILDMALLLHRTQDKASLIAFGPATVPQSAAAYRWAIPLAAYLLPEPDREELAAMGYPAPAEWPAEIAPSGGAAQVANMATKLRSAMHALSATPGMASKWRVLKQIWRHACRQAADRFPGQPLPQALLRTLMGQHTKRKQ